MLGGGFAVGAALLIAIAVRMAVLARATEIAVMRTVGATDSYIRRPFGFEGLFTGLAGGVLALGLTFGGYVLVDRSLITLSWLPDMWVVGGFLVAVLLGVSAAGLAVRRELRGIDVA
jgi:cell division transport system permease protein